MAVKQVLRLAKDHVHMKFRGHVWDGRGIRSLSTVNVWCDDEGVVRVWDDVTGHWTTCHAISEKNLRAIRKAAGLGMVE